MNFTLFWLLKLLVTNQHIASPDRIAFQLKVLNLNFLKLLIKQLQRLGSYPGILERLSFIDNKSKLKLRLLREPLNRTTGYVQRKAESADCKLDDLFVLFSTSRELKRK